MSPLRQLAIAAAGLPDDVPDEMHTLSRPDA